MLYIKNDEELLSHGNVELRRAAIDIIDHGIKNADPHVQVKKLVHVDGRTLHVGNDSFDLNHYTRIYVLGAGKATFPIAKALDDVLGELITDGVVICKYGQEGELKHQRLYHSSHPIPDENGYEACKELMKIARQTVDTDIVFSIATGGSTSLMPYPVDGVTIQEKRQTGLALLRSGANMWEMNYVRKHLTQAKAGFLAKAIAPGAPILNIGVSDGIGQGVDLCVEPSCPDDSTFADAQNVLTKYHLWNKVPESVANYIKNGTPEQETPKDLSDRNIFNYLVVDVNRAVEGAYERAKELGFNTMILSTFVEGESREIGSMHAAIAKEISEYNRPLAKPACFITGGEATMKINIPDPGYGGPSQQFALGAAVWLRDASGIVIVGTDTDGTDGPTDLAGGMVDCTTPQRADELGINIFEYMDAFNDGVALKKLGDVIYTGATGTNVNDLRIALVV